MRVFEVVFKKPFHLCQTCESSRSALHHLLLASRWSSPLSRGVEVGPFAVEYDVMQGDPLAIKSGVQFENVSVSSLEVGKPCKRS